MTERQWQPTTGSSNSENCKACGERTWNHIITFTQSKDGQTFYIHNTYFCNDACVEKYKELVKEW